MHAQAARRLMLAVALAGAALRPVSAQLRPLSIDVLYDPDPATRVNFAGTAPPALPWIDATHYAMRRGAGDTLEWVAVDAETGTATMLFQASRLERALASTGMGAESARDAARARTVNFNRSFSGSLLMVDDDVYVYTFATGAVQRLTSTRAAEEVPSFSPDGTNVAYVRQGNLFVFDLASRREVQLTSDGGDVILNGRLDWVYEEEIYGRGKPQGYWWSPDSKRLAYLRVDDRPIPLFTVVDHIPYEQRVERWRYPKAGEPNPIATLGVVTATGGATRWMNVAKYPDPERLISSVTWAPDGQRVVFQVQDRLQSWLDLNEAYADTGASRTLFRETGRPWVTEEITDPVWLRDGSFLWLSERSGFKHIYQYSADGTLKRQVTDGRWEVRTMHGADDRSEWVYFEGTERSVLGSDVYRARLAGVGLDRLSTTDGSHFAQFSPGFDYFTDRWSDVTTPPQVRLHRNNGSEVRVIEANRVDALDRYVFSKPEFLQVKTRDGFTMEAMLIKPPNFDPTRRYPVYVNVYGGPHAQRVRNQWASENLFLQLLAQNGIVVWECDNRTASGKGIESTWPVYGNFGELELRDVEDGLTWLKGQPYVDASRIGIHGWSFGGFLTTYALTHSTSFAMGIAGGTVSDWRNYDTMYTERYMGPPAENEQGYKSSAPRWSVANLHGSLLLIHGLIDDNVHVDNTMQLAYELQKAQKPFDLMLYPQSRHGVTDPQLVKHMRTLMFGFVLKHLRPENGAAEAAKAGRTGNP